jgi:uncharacterized protein DUF3352
MLTMRGLHLSLLAAFVLATVGCGGATKKSELPAGAAFAPSSAAAYISGITDPSSAQWRSADHLLSRFPGRGELLADFRKEMKKEGLTWERDIKPALGDDINIVWLDFANDGDNLVVYAKPKNEAKFIKLVESGDDPVVHRKIEGWTVLAEKKAQLDRFANARSSGSLADEDTFRNAMEKMPDDAAVRGYVSGKSIDQALEREAAGGVDAQTFRRVSESFGKLESLAFSASAENEGVRLEAASKSDPEPDVGNFSPALADQLPSGALMYVSFGNLEDFLRSILDSADKNFPGFQTQRAQFEDALGFSLKADLLPLFSREGGLAVYRGSPIPGIVFMLDVEGKEDKAQNVMRRFGALASLGGGAQTRTFKVDGVEAREITFPLEGFSVFSAVDDGKLVVTSTQKRLSDALGGGDKLADDPVYKQARESAEAPDETVGFVYANLREGLPFLFDAVEASGDQVPLDARANTKPLESAFLFAKRDGDRFSLSGFVSIR